MTKLNETKVVKQIILFIVVWIGSLPAYSQTNPYIKIGVNYNSLLEQYGRKDYINSEVEHEKSLGFHLGIGEEIKLSKYFKFNPEVQLIQKALKPKDYYLEFLTLFSYSLIKQASVELGPSSGILLFSENKDLRFFDIGANLGFTYSFTEKVKFTIRFNHSMFPVYKEEITYNYVDVGDPSTTPESFLRKNYNRNFQLSIMHRINSN
jgi:hypothetical protein